MNTVVHLSGLVGAVEAHDEMVDHVKSGDRSKALEAQLKMKEHENLLREQLRALLLKVLEPEGRLH